MSYDYYSLCHYIPLMLLQLPKFDKLHLTNYLFIFNREDKKTLNRYLRGLHKAAIGASASFDSSRSKALVTSFARTFPGIDAVCLLIISSSLYSLFAFLSHQIKTPDEDAITSSQARIRGEMIAQLASTIIK